MCVYIHENEGQYMCQDGWASGITPVSKHKCEAVQYLLKMPYYH